MLFNFQVSGDFFSGHGSVIGSWLDSGRVRKHTLCDHSTFIKIYFMAGNWGMFRVDLHMCFRALGLRMLTEMSGKKQTRNVSVSLIRRMAWLGTFPLLLTGFTSHWERVAGSAAETVDVSTALQFSVLLQTL